MSMSFNNNNKKQLQSRPTCITLKLSFHCSLPQAPTLWPQKTGSAMPWLPQQTRWCSHVLASDNLHNFGYGPAYSELGGHQEAESNFVAPEGKQPQAVLALTSSQLYQLLAFYSESRKVSCISQMLGFISSLTDKAGMNLFFPQSFSPL